MAKEEINAFLGAGTTYRGNLSFQGTVRIDGNFEGEVDSEGTLIVGREARLTGDFKIGQLVLSGTIEGEIHVLNKVIMHKEANLVGKLHTSSLIVEEGAVLEGQVSMGTVSEHAPGQEQTD